MVPPPPARNPVDQSLAWIRFGMEGKRICDEGGLEAFDDLVGLIESNIQEMAFGFSKGTTAQWNIIFGMWRMKYTLGIMHRAQDESRWSFTASLKFIYDAEEYKALLGTSFYWSTIRNIEDDQADTISKAADPGKFKDERTCPK